MCLLAAAWETVRVRMSVQVFVMCQRLFNRKEALTERRQTKHTHTHTLPSLLRPLGSSHAC